MKCKISHFALIALSATGTAFPGQADTITAQSFVEELASKVNVSGGTRAGLMLGAPGGPKSLGVLHFQLPQPSDSKLCVEITSSDGRYEAQLTADLSGLRPGPHSLKFASKHAEYPADAGDASIAAIARLSSDCGRPEADAYLPVSWAPIEDTNLLTIYVNSGRSKTQIVLPLKSGGVRSFSCKPLKASRRIAFDTICQVVLSPDAETNDMFIRRKRGFDELARILLPVRR